MKDLVSLKSIVPFASSLCLLAITATSTIAQDALGNDTPGDWVVTYYKPHGLWDTVCDQAMRDGETKDRCYIRYVDVFSPRPKFAAQFVFITPDDEGYHIELGVEEGTVFKGAGPQGGFKVFDEGKISWSYDPNICLIIGNCEFTGNAAEEFVAALADVKGSDAVLVSEFVDRHGAAQRLEWGITKFVDALDDFNRESELRDLR